MRSSGIPLLAAARCARLGTLDTTKIVKRLEQLAVAPYFAPCDRLREMARINAKFYPA